MRIAILAGQLADESPHFRLCEPDGSICINWLPGVELDDAEGALDRGGFSCIADAKCFALGIDYERALFGLLPGTTVEDIDRERGKLDSVGHLTSLHGAVRDTDGLLLAAQLAAPKRRRSVYHRGVAKLTVNQVRRIRADDSRNQVELAAKYGVTRLTIGNIIRRKTWRHVA